MPAPVERVQLRCGYFFAGGGVKVEVDAAAGLAATGGTGAFGTMTGSGFSTTGSCTGFADSYAC